MLKMSCFKFGKKEIASKDFCNCCKQGGGL